jgi:hypothetical protein
MKLKCWFFILTPDLHTRFTVGILQVLGVLPQDGICQYLDNKILRMYQLGKRIVVISFVAHFQVYLPAKVRRHCFHIQPLSAEVLCHLMLYHSMPSLQTLFACFPRS